MWFKQLIYLVADALLVTIALLAAFLLRFGLDMPPSYIQEFVFLLLLAILIKLTVFHIFGFHSQLWQYASLKEGLRLFKGISTASLLLLGALFFAQQTGIPRAVLVIDWFLTLGLVGGGYFFIRVRNELFSSAAAKGVEQKRVLIIGAGEAGSSLVRQMQHHPEKGYRPIAFLDDNPSKKGLMIHGIKVVGSSRAIPSIIADYPADEVIMAIPSAANQERRRIALECKEIGILCKTVPDIVELVDGKVNLSQIREIDIKELLGRKEVEIDLKNAVDCYRGRTILITGAAGSIGSELCRQAVALEPALVIATDISENGLYHLEEEMFSWLNGNKGIFEIHIMDVRDRRAVDRIFKLYKPEVIFHAAAYKHVPMMERHTLEAMQNNFLGTRVMIDAARRHNAERFVFISTDKAVNPTSIMGLSKQLGEKSIKVAASNASNTKFMAVRFGNVLGSNGSVIPKFKRQISSKEAVTITHPDITRYFMTIHEAVHLVIQATAIGGGGDIFVLNMGEPVKITDLARSMIQLFGFEPEKDIPIVYTGLRPGEKLYEELFAENEVVNNTPHPKIYEVVDDFNKIATTELLNELESIIQEGDDRELINLIHERHFVRA